MRRIIRPFVILFSTIILLASCLSDEDESNITYYSDTAITSFSLGTLKRTAWMRNYNDTEDSVYTAEIAGSAYKFYIDQLRDTIYNVDSLPVRTDTAHVICNVNAKNGGVIVLVYKNSAGEDSLAYYSDTDSINFGKKPKFRVYSNDGTLYRDYGVDVRVAKEVPDSINWHDCDDNKDFMHLTAMKAVAVGGRLIMFGRSGTETVVYTRTRPKAENAWEEKTRGLDASAWDNVAVKDGYVYTLSGGELLRTDDGASWTAVKCNPATPDTLIGAGKSKLYGYKGQQFMSSTDGVNWETDGMIGDADMRPSQYLSMTSLPLGTDKTAERVILTGIRKAYDGDDVDGIDEHAEDSVAMVWSKIEESKDGSESHSWICYDEKNGMQLPRLSDLSVVSYNGVLLALGGRGLGESTATAFSHFYVSEDNGLTWQKNDMYYLPKGFDNEGNDVFTMTVDDDNYIWIICGGTGKTWRGRLNRLGWADKGTASGE